jgi:hypothetical protein
VTEQVLDAHVAPRGGQLWEQLYHRIFQRELPLFDEHHDRRGRKQLRCRGELINGIRAHCNGEFDIRQSMAPRRQQFSVSQNSSG